MLNETLWGKILHFEFDTLQGEYDFTTRLAAENSWTQNFTNLAILEYKKFMYLAVISEQMVSPSEIVDIVWHQHLIFTKSYQSFCDLIGKQIQHIPSTHNKNEFDKFNQAKNQTQVLYTEEFGEQPNTIWQYSSMFESLHLPKTKYTTKSFTITGIFVFAILMIPAYIFIKPIYSKIQNPYFIIGYVTLIILTFKWLWNYNRKKLNNITKSADSNSFFMTCSHLSLFISNQMIWVM